MTDSEREQIQADLAGKNLEVVKEYCQMQQWKSVDVDEEKYLVHYGLSGDDFPMDFFFRIYPNMGSIVVTSLLPGAFTPEQYEMGAVALNAVNFRLSTGAFTMNFKDGKVYFGQTTFYGANVADITTIDQLVISSMQIVDEYNDQFFMLQKGNITISQFLEKMAGK